MFDRGYPSFHLFRELCASNTLFLFRCSAKPFAPVERFIKSGASEAVIDIAPTYTFLNQLPRKERPGIEPITLRLVRMDHPNGSTWVFATNLLDTVKYPREALGDLYRRRYDIELQYRDEKVIQEIETFHGHSENSIRQELFAVGIMTIIAKLLSATVANDGKKQGCFPQAKHAIIALANDAAMLTAHNPERAIEIFRDLLEELNRVLYYPPKKPRAYPRLNKSPRNKWKTGKQKDHTKIRSSNQQRQKRSELDKKTQNVKS